VCSASSSSLSLYSVELGYTSTFTRPLVYFSASSRNLSAPLPLGVSSATTWLNLITIGCCAKPRWPASAKAPIVESAVRRCMEDLLGMEGHSCEHVGGSPIVLTRKCASRGAQRGNARTGQPAGLKTQSPRRATKKRRGNGSSTVPSPSCVYAPATAS